MVPVPMMLDLDRLRASPLERDPFDFVIVDNFIRAEYLPAAVADFPPLASHGSFPMVPGIAPLAGMAVAFRRSETSFHGHYAHTGERRSVQLNWVTDDAVVRRELGRHRWSARLKALNPFA